jgi:hypothetical protein
MLNYEKKFQILKSKFFFINQRIVPEIINKSIILEYIHELTVAIQY